MKIKYFRKQREHSITHYAVHGLGLDMKVMAVRNLGGDYTVSKPDWIPEKVHISSKEEFETEYDNAINSFMPFLS